MQPSEHLISDKVVVFNALKRKHTKKPMHLKEIPDRMYSDNTLLPHTLCPSPLHQVILTDGNAGNQPLRCHSKSLPCKWLSLVQVTWNSDISKSHTPVRLACCLHIHVVPVTPMTLA